MPWPSDSFLLVLLCRRVDGFDIKIDALLSAKIEASQPKDREPESRLKKSKAHLVRNDFHQLGGSPVIESVELIIDRGRALV